jgi:hypothetical protein
VNKSLFDFDSYKDYLHEQVKREGRGTRQRMATAMNCQLAYVSVVLGGDRNLSIDQAESLARHLGLNQDETEFFIWLVEKERAGTEGSIQFFTRLIERKREERGQLNKRINIKTGLKESAKSIYYSDMLYSAVHMAVTVPALQTRQALALRFETTLERINEIVSFLKENALLTEERDRLKPGDKYVFLDRKSPYIGIHHANWRMAALRSVARKRSDDTHLSMVVSVSDSDAKLVRAKIAACIEDIGQTIKSSREEAVMAFSLDFFRV